MNDEKRSESARMALAGIFAPRSAAQLRHRKDDLLHRAALVTEFGWDGFRYQWSTGEVLATALVLNDKAEITAMGRNRGLSSVAVGIRSLGTRGRSGRPRLRTARDPCVVRLCSR